MVTTERSQRGSLAATTLITAVAAVVGFALGCRSPDPIASTQESVGATSCPVGQKLVCESSCDPPPCTKPFCFCLSKDDACIGRPDGTACDDFDGCTQSAVCQSSICVGSSPITCNALDQCHQAGICNGHTGLCSNPPVADGTPCSGGSCQGGVCLGEINIFDANGTPLFGTNVPTDNTFSLSVNAGDLGNAWGANRTVQLVPSSFPPGQHLVTYDYNYGEGPNDQGGSSTVGDLDAGHWPCLPTAFTSLMGPPGSSVTATHVDTFHAVRYVGGDCRVNVPMAPFFREAEQRIVDSIDTRLANTPPGIIGAVQSLISFDYFELAQPHFRGEGSDLQMGFLFEAQYKFSLAFTLATVSINPSFTFGLRPSDGLFQMTNPDQNVVVLLPGNPYIQSNDVKTEIRQGIMSSVNIADTINTALSPTVAQFMDAVGLGSDTTISSCSTPTPAQPSQECFDNVVNGIERKLNEQGISTDLSQLAELFIQPINFTCDNQLQCRFHPVLQAVNVLPDSIEIVLAPDLRNPTFWLNGPLVQFFQLIPPFSLSVPVNLGGVDVTIGVGCGTPQQVTSGHITTVFKAGGDGLDMAAGIRCVPFSQP